MSRSLLRYTGIFSGMTLISRVLGFVRDVILAITFAPGLGLDAFLVAFKIPNFMRRLFAEGAFSQAFVPVLSETRTREDAQSVKSLVDVVGGTLAGVLVLVTVVGVAAAPALVALFAPGFVQDPAKFELSVDLLRLTFPYLLFISLTAFAGAILNTFNRFAVPAFTPVLLNLCLIGAALWLTPYFEQPVTALAVGVFVAGLAQLAFQGPFVRRVGLLPRPRWGWRDPRVRRILRLMLPVLFGSSVAQVSLLLDTVIASFLQTGSVTWLYLSDRLMEFPLGVFTIAVSTVILPNLSAHHAEVAPARFSATLDWALRVLMLIVTPAMVGLFVLAGPLVASLFHYREFQAYDVAMTRYSLMAFAFGLLGFSLVKVLIPGFYARQDTMTPVRCGVIAFAVNMALNLVFVAIIMALDLPAAHVGLAIATSIGAFVNAGLLFRGLRRERAYEPAAGWAGFGLRLVLANAAMGSLLAWLAGPLQRWLDWDAATRALHLAGIVFAGAALYFVVLAALGLRPRHFVARS